MGICLRAPGVPCSQKIARPCGAPNSAKPIWRSSPTATFPSSFGRSTATTMNTVSHAECGRLSGVRDFMAHHGVMAGDELDELYSVRPEEFTALRTKLAAAAKKSGDTAAAKRISAARRPTTAAWVVNVLVSGNEDVKHSL